MKLAPRLLTCTLLGLYWPVLLITTHIPRLNLGDFRVVGQDKTLHFFAYGMLALLFWLAFFGSRRPSFRGIPLYITLLLLALVTAGDEITQRFFQRDTDLRDWVADMIGVGLALFMLFALRRVWHWLVLFAAGFFLLGHWPGGRFMWLPEIWEPYRPVLDMAAYLTLTLLAWCSLGRGRFAWSWQIGFFTIGAIMAFALLDEGVSACMGHGFDVKNLMAALVGLATGLLAALALARHRQVEQKLTPA